MKHNRLKSVITVLLAVILLCGCLTGCMTGGDSSSQGEKPIKVALTQDMLSFDPILTSDIYSEAVLRCVYTSLYDFDESLTLRPKLAKSSTVVDDTTWRIEIHDNVKFHDGSPLTAKDVVFSIERARNGERTKKLLEMIVSIEEESDTSFLLHSKEPYPDFLAVFAKAEMSIVSQKVVSEQGYDFTTPVGAGPFKLISREVGSRISLESFDEYFKEKAATRYLDFEVIVTEQERTAAFLNGSVDMLFSVSAYDCDKLRVSQGVELLQSPSTKIEYLSLNTQHEPLNDPKVRLAISYAINRDNITSAVYHGYSVPASSTIPKGINGYVESPITYDPEKARELLKEAGQEDGFSFTVITIDTIRKNTLEYIKLDLAAVGIELNYNLVTMKEAVELMNAGEHDSILVGWAFNSDPNSVLPLIFGTGSGKTMNSSNYTNPIVDDLFIKARGEADSTKKTELYEEINRLITADSPVVVLQNPMVLAAAREDIKGTSINPQGIFDYEKLFRS